MFDLDNYPRFHESQEDSLKIVGQYRERGLWPVASVLTAGNLTVRQCFMLHERRNQLAEMGAIAGPCVIGDAVKEVMPGVSFYVAEIPSR